MSGASINTIVGTRFADVLKGKSTVRNYILAGNGDNKVTGGTLNDYIEAGSGNDTINSGAGNDIIYAGNGKNTILSGDGNDRIYSGSGADYISGGNGHDYIESGSGDDRVYGGEGNDRVYASAGNDTLYGAAGNDRLFGESGNDLIRGGDGNDFIHGGTGDDVVNGDAGNDTIYGGSGKDTLYGGDGIDYIYGESGNDRINGGAGDDRLYGGDGNDYIDTGTGIRDIVYGGTGNDDIRVNSTSAYVYGEVGNDNFVVAKNVQYARLDGGEGTDAARIGYKFSDVTIKMNSNGSFTFTAGGQKIDAFNIENFTFADGTSVTSKYLTAFYTQEATKADFLDRWTTQDALYQQNGYYDVATNKLGIKIAVDYIKYLENGGEPLTDVIVKSDASRSQSIHDNFLGNLTQAALEDRGLLSYAKSLSFLVEQFLDRPWNGGYFNDTASTLKTIAWDYENGVNRKDYASYNSVTENTTLSAAETKGNGTMLTGSGIPANDFHKVSFAAGGITFSLKADKYGSTYNDHVDGNKYHVEQGMSDINGNRADWSFYMSVQEGQHGSGMTLGNATQKGDFDLGIYIDIDPSGNDQFIFIGNLEEFADSKTSNSDVFQNSFNFNFNFIKDYLPAEYKDDFMGDAEFGIELRLNDLAKDKMVAVNHIDVLL